MSSFGSSVSIPKAEQTVSWALSNVTIPDAGLLFSKARSSTSWLATTLAVVGTLLAVEQVVYRNKKRHLPGATWTIPVIGRFIDSLYPSLDNYKKGWAAGPLSVISVFHIFIVMATSNDYSRKIFNSPTYTEPCLVQSAKQVLKPNNWVFLSGPAHVAYRKVLNTLFTRKALSIYCTMQDKIVRQNLAQWLQHQKENAGTHEIMWKIRDMNMEMSLRVFCARHISDEGAKQINSEYWKISKALELVNFPLAIPGTKIYGAIQSRKIAMKHLEKAAHDSKEYIAKGGVPECMLDEWNAILQAPGYKGRTDFSDEEMAMVILSFLFASQDAMSSGLTFGFQHMIDHPEVLAKIRAEQESAREGDFNAPVNLEHIDNMPYLQAVIKESLRVQPPVTMVPYKTLKPFPISDDYVVPAGSMVIPSIWPSLHDPEVYPEPETFRPDRWLDPNSSANQNPKNYMVWGAGIHRCIGVEYVFMSISLTLGIAATMLDMEHEVTPLSNEVQLLPTLFPQDGCRLKLSPRA